MTWFMRNKTSGTSDLVGGYTLPTSVRVLAQSASASADYTTAVWSGLDFTAEAGFGGIGTNVGHGQPYSGVLEQFKILGAYLITDTAVTGGGATVQATANILLYDDTGTIVGTTLFSLLFATGVNTVAFQPKSLGAVSTTLRAASNLPSGFGIREDETLVFEWKQSATTGLALPAAVVVLDIV